MTADVLFSHHYFSFLTIYDSLKQVQMILYDYTPDCKKKIQNKFKALNIPQSHHSD